MLFNHEKFITEGFGSSESSGGGRVGGVGKAGKSGRGGSTTGKGKLGPPVDKHWAERWRLELKLATVSKPLVYSKDGTDASRKAAIPTPDRDGDPLET